MSKRNVLLICSDEHSRRGLGCYGSSVAQTPALDKLAASGTRFTRGYTPSPICVSARASLATGLQVFENHCWSSAQPYYGQMESWMHRARDAGHAVVSIGKLHFRSSDDDNGFSEEILPLHLTNGGRGWPQSLLRDPLPPFPEASELAQHLGAGDTDYINYDKRVTQEAVKWLQNSPQSRTDKTDKPWVLSVSMISPHYPLMAPPEFYELYDGIDMPTAIQSSPDHPVLKQIRKFWNYDDYFDDDSRKKAMQGYFGLCSFLDYNIAQVMKALEESGQADNTIVLYISDHGEMLGDHGFWTKSVMYEPSVGVPIIMAGAGIPTGSNATPVSLIDVAATIESALGLVSPERESWQSQPLQHIANTPDLDRMVISEYHDGGSPTGYFMVRQGIWKYIYYAGGYAPQLFHMENDPQELNDLGEAAELAQVRAELHDRLVMACDPEAINKLAFDDQAALAETYGGREGILNMAGFNFTPIPD